MRRRDFVRIVVTGSIASLACPRGAPAGAAATASPAAAHVPEPALSPETWAACHALRDGTVFPAPPPSRHIPVVIVGGGMAGLAAARELGSRPYLLIEKESWIGGNATGEAWRGVGFSTGTSYNNDHDLKALAGELGVRLLPIDSVDGLVIGDTFVPDFLGAGLDRAPYPPAVRAGIRRFLDTYAHTDVAREAERLDNLPFAQILKDYPPELTAFFDAFGPNSWGGQVADTSAYVGIQAAQWAGGIEKARYTGEEGFGLLTRAMGEAILSGGRDRIVLGTTVIRVQADGDRVLVAYVPAGEGGTQKVTCVSADTVVVAAPKFIARRVVAGLPAEQSDAMGRIRYAPYMVANLCFDGVVHDSCFDTNIIGPDIVSDFVCADWPVRRGVGPKNRPTVLSCYMPLKEADRAQLLDEAASRAMALAALHRIDRVFPGAERKCREIRVRLRGHPMHFSTCGMITRWGPRSRQSLGAIHFACTDGVGDVSDLSTALSSGRQAARLALTSLDAAARRRA
jgi:monoamine oxidase